jgi:predicted GIY-YIG superfamily endonuclease
MYYVYILQSEIKPTEIYKGFTEDLKSRLNEHNQGNCDYTKKFKPWKIIFYCAFTDKKKAVDFEKYLKSASGIAFMRKRLI